MNKIIVEKLIKAYKKKRSAKLRDALILELKPLVQNIARKFGFRGESYDDIYQIGMIGLLKGLEYYQVSSKHEFIPYIIAMTIGEIKHYFRDNFNNIRIPRKYIEISTAVNNFIQQYSQKNKGLKPTLGTIAKSLHYSVEDILETSEALHVSRLVNGETEYSHDESLPENLPAGGSMPSADFTSKIDTLLFLDNILKGLPYREQKILQMYFLHNVTQREIANRFRLSQTQVFRLLNKALEHCKAKIKQETGSTL